MSDAIAVGVVTACAAIIGSFGATILANAHSRRVVRQTRLDRLRDNARADVAAAVISGRRWAHSLRGYVIYLAGGQTRPEFEKRLFDSASEPVTQRLSEQSTETTAALTRAAMTVRDDDLSRHLVDLRVICSSVTGALIDELSKFNGSGKRVETLTHVLGVVDGIDAKLDDLEQSARSIFARELNER